MTFSEDVPQGGVRKSPLLQKRRGMGNAERESYFFGRDSGGIMPATR